MFKGKDNYISKLETTDKYWQRTGRNEIIFTKMKKNKRTDKFYLPKFAGVPSIKTLNWFNFWMTHSMELYTTNYSIHHIYISVQGVYKKTKNKNPVNIVISEQF